MLNYLKWLSGLALVSLFTVGDLPGVFPKAVARLPAPRHLPRLQPTRKLLLLA